MQSALEGIMEDNKSEKLMYDFLQSIGLDMKDEHLIDTPKRVVKMYKEMFKGLTESEPRFTIFSNPGYDEMIISTGEYKSLCSHHLLNFSGKFYFCYIPDKKICGLSKIARVVEHFSARPQLQERLTQQIADYLEEKLKPKGLMLVMEGTHLCQIMRGVKQNGQHAKMITSAVKGVFLKPEPGKTPKEEFLRLIGLNGK